MIEFLQNHLFETLWLGVTAVLGCLTTCVKKEITKRKLTEQGILALLHSKLYENCTKYINQGYITISALKDLEYVYKSYHALGGNGTGTELYESCCKLKKVPDGTVVKESEE